MNDRYVRAIEAAEVAPGGMKAVDLEGREIVICNCEGRFHAVARRCGHMNAPLEMGTLDGTILTCAMHCAQFDVTTGEVLAGPVPADLGGEAFGPKTAAMLGNVGALMPHIHTEPIGVYETKVEAGWVMVAEQKRGDR